MNDFFSQVKSTIDFMGVGIAQAYDSNTDFIDLDDAAADQESITAGHKAIVWELATLEEAPIDPLWILVFGMGARTLDDPGRYNMADLLGAVKSKLQIGGTYPIKDYSPDGDAATKRGDFTVTGISVDPQLFDKAAGLRMVAVTARCVRVMP